MTPLRQERERRRWSRARLAHELEVRAKGRSTLATRTSLIRMISAWESGSRDTSEPYRSLLAEVYGRPAEALGMNGGMDRISSSVGLSYPRSMPDALVALEDLARFDNLDHAAVTRGRYQPDALNAACIDWLFSTPDDAVYPSNRDRVGAKDVEEIRTTTAMFDALDRRFGGENSRSAAVLYLQRSVAPLLRLSTTDEVKRNLYRAVAILCELIGWMSYDTARHSLAQRYFTQALRFAGAAEDRTYASYVLTSMAHQALFLGRSQQALRLAQVARDASERAKVPVAMTEARVFEARAYAAQGDRRRCTVALRDAEHSFNQVRLDAAPEWATHWDAELFASHMGTCWVELGLPTQAEDLIKTAWQGSQDQTRRRAYGAVQLAQIALLKGEIEEAAVFGIGAIETMNGSTSHRSRQRLSDLGSKLEVHSRNMTVSDFHERLRHAL